MVRAGRAHLAQRDALSPEREGADASDAEKVGCLDDQHHGKRLLLRHAEQPKREDRADCEAAGQACEIAEDDQETQENDQEKILHRLQCDTECETCPEKVRGGEQLYGNAGQQDTGAAPSGRPGDPIDKGGREPPRRCSKACGKVVIDERRHPPVQPQRASPVEGQRRQQQRK